MTDPNTKKILVTPLDTNASEIEQLNSIGKQLAKLLYTNIRLSSIHKLNGKKINIQMPKYDIIKIPECPKIADVNLKCKCINHIRYYKQKREIESLRSNIRNIAVHACKHNIQIEISYL
jgi:hypothetical protein